MIVIPIMLNLCMYVKKAPLDVKYHDDDKTITYLKKKIMFRTLNTLVLLHKKKN